MQLFQVDDEAQLFISPEIEDWDELSRYAIDTVIDLDGGLDLGVPTVPNQCLYIYFPINDSELPALSKLEAIGRLGASLIQSGHRVLSHCGMGFNRSALVAGRILCELGLSGEQAVAQIRARRPGALYNEWFASHLQSLGLESSRVG